MPIVLNTTVALVLTAFVVHGQPDARLSGTELQMYVERLELSDDQTQAVWSFHRAYRDQLLASDLSERSTEFHDLVRMAASGESKPLRAWLDGYASDWRAHLGLEATFWTAVESVLTDNQSEALKATCVWRSRRRLASDVLVREVIDAPGTLFEAAEPWLWTPLDKERVAIVVMAERTLAEGLEASRRHVYDALRRRGEVDAMPMDLATPDRSIEPALTALASLLEPSEANELLERFLAARGVSTPRWPSDTGLPELEARIQRLHKLCGEWHALQVARRRARVTKTSLNESVVSAFRERVRLEVARVEAVSSERIEDNGPDARERFERQYMLGLRPFQRRTDRQTFVPAPVASDTLDVWLRVLGATQSQVASVQEVYDLYASELDRRLGAILVDVGDRVIPRGNERETQKGQIFFRAGNEQDILKGAEAGRRAYDTVVEFDARLIEDLLAITGVASDATVAQLIRADRSLAVHSFGLGSVYQFTGPGFRVRDIRSEEERVNAVGLTVGLAHDFTCMGGYVGGDELAALVDTSRRLYANRLEEWCWTARFESIRWTQTADRSDHELANAWARRCREAQGRQMTAMQAGRALRLELIELQLAFLDDIGDCIERDVAAAAQEAYRRTAFPAFYADFVTHDAIDGAGAGDTQLDEWLKYCSERAGHVEDMIAVTRTWERLALDYDSNRSRCLKLRSELDAHRFELAELDAAMSREVARSLQQ